MRKYLIFLLLCSTLTSFSGFSQENPTRIKGRVESLKNDVSSILIVNLNSKESTITDSLGLFTMEVKLRDLLQFSAVQFHLKTISISDSIFRKKTLVVHLVENIINLNEVTVMPYNLTGKIEEDIERLHIAPAVTSSTLGLPNADVEIMTQSELLLLEADRGKYANFYVIALTINTHKIMNRLSGRTKSFEERLARDKDMELEKQIIAKFSKKTISENFDIPETNIDGFLTYCMAQNDFSGLLQARNTAEIWEYLRAKSIAFKKTDALKK